MNAVNLSTFASTSAEQHHEFLLLLPIVERHARVTFRGLNAAEREEAIAEAVAVAFTSFIQLKQKGRSAAQFPTRLAVFAVLGVQNDRHVGSRCNSRDVLGRKAQFRYGFRVEQVPEGDHGLAGPFVDDRTSIPDQVAMRIDFPAFLQSLCERDRRMALMLAEGYAAKEIASIFDVSPPRVTQLRQVWHQEWVRFHGGEPITAA